MTDGANCPSCGAPFADAYCARCGEKRLVASDLSTREFIGQVFGALFNFEGKFFRCLARLAKPGFLSAEFVRGARVRYLKPFQLFALLNLIYFFVQPWTDSNVFFVGDGHYWSVVRDSRWYQEARAAKRAELGLDAPQDEARFSALVDRAANDWAKSLIVAFIPALAAFAWLLAPRATGGFGAALVLASEFMAFKLAYLCVVFPLALRALRAAFSAPSLGLGDWSYVVAVTAIVSLATIAWFALAAQRVLRLQRLRAFAYGVALTAAYTATLWAYHVLLIFIAFGSMGKA